MKPKVFIAAKVPVSLKEMLSQSYDCHFGGEDTITRENLLKNIAEAHGIMLQGHKVDEEFIKAAPKLKIVSNISVGYNNFDIDAMKKFGIMGTNTPGVLDDTVADLVIGLMLSTARRLPELDRYVKNKKWQATDNESLFGIDVHHKKLGIIGMGRIGEVIAKRARFGFDMSVSYYKRTRNDAAEKKLGVIYESFDTLISTSDFIVVMVPLTEGTINLIDANAFKKMKPSAIFINASRGQTVDESALLNAVKTHQIFGAGLDVFVDEPVPADNPLLHEDRIVTVPHIGSATQATRDAMATVAAQNMIEGLNGKVPPNIVKELK